MKFKQKVTIDGVEREVEIELSDEQYMTVEQHNLRLKTQVERRLARQAASIRKELLEDEEFVGEVLTKKGVDPKTLKAAGSGKDADAEAIGRAQNEVRERELKPLKAQVDELSGELTTTRHNQLVSELTEAMIDAGVRKTLARRFAEVEVNRGVFGFDKEQQKGWAVKEGEGFAFAPNASKERPFKGPKEFAEDWAKDKANADFIDKGQQKGPGVQNTQLGGGTGNVRTKADLKTPAESAAFIKDNGFDAYAALPLK